MAIATFNAHAATGAVDGLLRGFEPLELCSLGPFAEVWKAIDTHTGRVCALKRLRTERGDDPLARQLIENEAIATATAPSKHLLKLYRAEPAEPIPFLVFEWVEGIALEQELRGAGTLELRRAVWIARQRADAMRDLESVGLAHGDIKPQNVLITFGGEVKLTDLGFVRSLASPSAADRARPAAMSVYMAPESLTECLSPPVAKDVYSLGVVLFRMLAGRLPFSGDAPEIARQMRPPLVRHFRPEVPRELADLVSRMLAKQPVRRPQNLRTLIREMIDLELRLISTELDDPSSLAG